MVAKRRYPTSEARGGGREKQPHFRGAMAARVQEGLKELSHIQGQGSGRECQAATTQEQTRGATLLLRPGAVATRSNPTPEARGGGREEQPHDQGAVSSRAQGDLEERLHVQGQEGWW